MLTVSNLSVSLGEFELSGVNFSVSPGEYFVLLGMSGAGKSVLLHVIGGLTAASAGSVLLNGKDITRERIQRRRVGMVFQDAALFPHMSVFNNIAFPLRAKGLDREMIQIKVAELAELTSLTHLLKRSPGNLSGGEMQRTALARALALEPECLLLDEPLSSLDAQLRGDMRTLLRVINEKGQTIIHVTHDYEEAVLLANRIGVIEKGTVVQTGTPGEVFRHPRSEFVARFIGIRNFFSGRLKEGDRSLRHFSAGGNLFKLLSDESPGEGYVAIRAEDIILSDRMQSSSAVNNFEGAVVSTGPARIGSEVIVDIGHEISVQLSDRSLRVLKLYPGKRVWISFKASAVRFIRK